MTIDDQATTTTSATTAPGPERFEGTDDEFYRPPDPLPPGAPGDPIRVMEVGRSEDAVTLKVMYRSLDAAGRDRAVTGLITHPTAAPPEGGWPIVATAPGTVGVAPHCGMSRIAPEAPDWGVEGVRVMTDYQGLGTVGGPLHAYLSRPGEGRSVIDGVRAARRLPETGAGDRWVSVGHSQGGHGALAAHELAGEYAPELELVATLALAPAAMLDRVYGGLDPVVTAVLTAMSLVGGAGEHPEIDVADYASPELLAVADAFATGCLDEITEALLPLVLAGTLFTADPRHTEPARSLLLANDVGHVAVDAPLLLVSGTADDRVAIDRVHDLHDRLRATGQATELVVVEGATHDSVIPETAERTAAWLRARLADDPTGPSTDLAG